MKNASADTAKPSSTAVALKPSAIVEARMPL
jgi:hypothetical protein